MKLPFSLVLIALIFLAKPVQADSLDFLFTETVAGGTITGEIDGLNSTLTGGISTPTAVIINSQPAGYPDMPLHLNLLTDGYGFYMTSDTFTVTSGAITGANVGIYKTIPPGTDAGDYQGYGFDFTSSALGFSNDNGIFLASNVGTVLMSNANSLGFPGIAYTAVPEPHQTMAIFLLAGVGLLVARKLYAKVQNSNLQPGLSVIS